MLEIFLRAVGKVISDALQNANGYRVVNIVLQTNFVVFIEQIYTTAQPTLELQETILHVLAWLSPHIHIKLGTQQLLAFSNLYSTLELKALTHGFKIVEQ